MVMLMLTLKAPAKINLTLEVLGKRSDGFRKKGVQPEGFRQKGAQPEGFHEIRSVLQTIDLCDTLHLEVGWGVSFQCDMPGWSADKSLVSKTVNLLRETTGCTKGAKISIEKRIPLMSGLGGDSSDAAAILRGLNELWRLNLSTEKLVGLAAQLGSDVVFFLHGGTALVAGRGEIITPLPPLIRMWVVLVIPDVPVEPGKTGRMYAALKPSHFTNGKITQKLVETLHKGEGFSPSMLFNTFENIAFDDYNIRRVYVEHLIKIGAPHVHLAGSGPTLFTILEEREKAVNLFKICRNQGMKTYLVGTL
jgi:4-diphosphocytidyl-2-C-methyl-D-erythritol kinase